MRYIPPWYTIGMNVHTYLPPNRMSETENTNIFGILLSQDLNISQTSINLSNSLHDFSLFEYVWSVTVTFTMSGRVKSPCHMSNLTYTHVATFVVKKWPYGL